MPAIRYNFGKNLMYRPREKFKNVDFGPKNDIYPILGKIRTFLKK